MAIIAVSVSTMGVVEKIEATGSVRHKRGNNSSNGMVNKIFWYTTNNIERLTWRRKRKILIPARQPPNSQLQKK